MQKYIHLPFILCLTSWAVSLTVHGQGLVDDIVAPLNRGLSVEINQAAATGNVQQPASHISGDGNVTLTLNKRIFQRNDHLTVTVRANQDCFVRIFHKGVDGSITQIFPNKAQSDNKVRAGVPVVFPGPNAGFKFRVHEPYGDEVILAVATFKQLHQDRYGPEETFKTYKTVHEVKEYISRGLSVVSKNPHPATTPGYTPPKPPPTPDYTPPTPPTPQYTPPPKPPAPAYNPPPKPSPPQYTPPVAQYEETVSHVAVAFRIQAYY